mmetsp:Transcript_3610/g.8234  ORF Transcript_3610/g.8234 Transcript_3610/m.8234 type:complete len:330 (+) Transcript_3610:93-1082(+)
MAKFLVAVAATAASMVSASLGDPWMYTLTGACDAQNDVNGMTFVKQGNTLSGAPYYKALRAEKYMYYDPDCGEDGEARWVIDVNRPSVNKTSDLDGDGLCDDIGLMTSQYTFHPPTAGEWSMLCDGIYHPQFLTLLEGTSTMTVTTTATPTTTTSTSRNGTTTTTKSTKASLILGGTCAYKRALNGMIFDFVGAAADGSPIYKARGLDEYIYRDADCDGAGNVTAARWVFDNSKPSSTATKDLDGDGNCTYHASLDSAPGGTSRPPASAEWSMYCGEASGWMSVGLTLQEVPAGDAKATHDLVINSARRNGIVATVAAVSLVTAQVLFA